MGTEHTHISTEETQDPSQRANQPESNTSRANQVTVETWGKRKVPLPLPGPSATQRVTTWRVNQMCPPPPPGLTTFSGSLCPGRYFTFSWSLLMMSVNFLPLTVSSKTHILTVEANFCRFFTLFPMIFATADPLQGDRRGKKCKLTGEMKKAFN